MASRRTAPDPLARQVAFGLSTVGLALRADAWRTGSARSLTPTQGRILAILASRAGPMRPGALAASLAVSAPTASDAIRSLEEKGLVRRASDADDGRATAVHLTDAGAAAVAAWDRGPAFVLEAVRALTTSERGALVRALAKVLLTLADRGEIPSARTCGSCVFFAPHAHRRRGVAPHHCRFLDEPLAETDVRLDCPDHEPASPTVVREALAAWSKV
ncbi:MAG: MarR family transcriptional regulator [Gemmatimonadaceae bacterium]|nr:MarR family transcriptional regulator [Gemmatimonadaceae bacterium]